MMGEVDSIPGSCRKKRDVQRETNRARNRLLSIRYDVETYINPLMRTMRCIAPTTESWPILANHRCGTWYTGETSTQACYFKSVDGHVGTWNFSLKRLNLHVVRTVAQTDGCFIMDASRTKVYPDSLSRTIPIWAAVLNRFVARVRRERALDVDDSFWDEQLYTPESISDEEHETIENLLNDRVHQLYSSGAIIHPGELIKMMIKPIRPVWIARQADSETILGELEHLVTKYFVVVCVSCSGSINGIMSIAQNNFIYSPGSADDEESWARGLTPREFWAHVDDILCTSFSCDDTDRKIDEIVAMKARGDGEPLEGSNAQELGCTGVWIGSRRAGRPPDCWDRFDAILNVTTTEYKQMNGSNDLPVGKYYLNLPVDEGKRDKNELERWLAVGIVFAMYHRTCARQVLIHCAQGRDRSCAVALAIVALFCIIDEAELRFISGWTKVNDLVNSWNGSEEDLPFKHSGLPRVCVENLIGRAGRDVFCEWFTRSFLGNLPANGNLATKASLRIALQAVHRYRQVVSPSRSTMQKLNRFFMSAEFE